MSLLCCKFGLRKGMTSPTPSSYSSSMMWWLLLLKDDHIFDNKETPFSIEY